MTKILKAFVLLSVAVIVFDYVLGKCPNILYKDMIFLKKYVFLFGTVVSKLKSRHAALWMLGEDVADDYALIRSILRRQRLPDVPKSTKAFSVSIAKLKMTICHSLCRLPPP